MIAVLLGISLLGCVWLSRAPRHSIPELVAVTLALSPLMMLAMLGVDGLFR